MNLSDYSFELEDVVTIEKKNKNLFLSQNINATQLNDKGSNTHFAVHRHKSDGLPKMS